jgi:glycosyltransferase involved in cell wall biosynthesis
MMNPRTGPWSVMKQLAAAQRQTGLYTNVALGIITDSNWPREQEAELPSLGKVYRKFTPTMPGTLQHLYQLVRRPGIEAWVNDLAAVSGANHVVVHFHNAWTSGAFLPLRRTTCPVSVVVTFHGIAGAAPLRQQPVRRAIHRVFARRLRGPNIRLTSVDTGCFDSARELFGLERGFFTVIPNGMPAGNNQYGPYCRGAGCLTVAHVGSLTEDKGWRLAAEAVVSLSRSGRRLRLVIAGTGPQEMLARDLTKKHPDCITYLGHVADPCREVLPGVDVFVLMTSNDGLPMAIIEAMSCDIPVVATSIGGIPDAIANGESGYLVERSAAALAGVLDSLCQNPSRLAALSAGTRRRFAERFDIANIVRAYGLIYQECVAGTQRKG